jgi:UPF0755 protein
MPPRQGRPERKPPRGQIARRRAVAALLLLGFLGLALWLGVSALGGGETDTPPPVTTAAPKPVILRVLFPEGFTRKEMVKRVAEVRQIAKAKRKVTPRLSGDAYAVASKAANVPRSFGKQPASIEGFLFPATYEFTPKTTAKRLVADQIEHFEQNWKKVELGYAKTKNLTPYDVLIIASMVEKETIAPDERPLVAAVIYNRLKAGMPLGIDATIRYVENNWTRPLRVSELERDTPYNSRLHTGLPPTPIGNPGFASLKAAAHPANVPYLFYVVKPGTCGQHAFSSTDAQRQRDVARYEAARQANGGKSPDTC